MDGGDGGREGEGRVGGRGGIQPVVGVWGEGREGEMRVGAGGGRRLRWVGLSLMYDTYRTTRKYTFPASPVENFTISTSEMFCSVPRGAKLPRHDGPRNKNLLERVPGSSYEVAGWRPGPTFVWLRGRSVAPKVGSLLRCGSTMGSSCPSSLGLKQDVQWTLLP